MKQKPDETPDQWIRQSLGQLPDTPPPGSTFDKDRLWAQLQPDLQAIPARRSIGRLWWMAAACLTGLALGWFWLAQSSDNQKIAVRPNSNSHPNAPMVAYRIDATQNASLNVVSARKARPTVEWRKPIHQKEVLKQESPPQPTETVFPKAEFSSVAEVPPVVETRPEPGKPTVAIVAPKRQFRVVHENELRAEEETRPKLYRAEHFVRLGNGTQTETSSAVDPPAPVISLTTKSIQ